MRLQSRGQDAKELEGEVKRSRAVLGHGQEVKALFWAVKDLDRGRKCLNRLYGSDTPLAWLSVMVKQGLELLQKPKIVKCIWEESFGEVLERLDSSYREMTVLKISIGQDVCFKGAQMVSIDSPILLCEQFNCKFVCYDLKPGVASGSMVAMPTDQRRNGLEVLMNRSRDLVLL